MANGDVGIHNRFSDHKELTTAPNCDPKSASDSMADTVEFRLLIAYAKRRRPKRDAESTSQKGPTAPPSPPKIPVESEKGVKEKKNKTKSRAKGLSGMFARFKPQTKKVASLQPPAMPIMDNRCLVLSKGER